MRRGKSVLAEVLVTTPKMMKSLSRRFTTAKAASPLLRPFSTAKAASPAAPSWSSCVDTAGIAAAKPYRTHDVHNQVAHEERAR